MQRALLPVTALVVMALASSPGRARAAEGERLTPPPSAPPVPPTPPAPVPLAPRGAPWLGIHMSAGGDLGVTVEKVVRGSPADKAGILAGDRIVSVDGARTSAPAQITRGVSQHKVGDALAVDIERRGTASSLDVVLAARPSGDDILKMDLVGAPAPAWSRVSVLAGAPSTVAQLRGRVVLVDFWASWCGPCRLLAPRLSALKDRFGAQGLTVVGITTDDAERAAVFAEKSQMRYGVVIDQEGDTSRAYGITGLPTMILIDKRGIVRDVFVGYDPGTDAHVEAAVKALLAEGAPAPPPPPSVPRPPGR